MTLTIAENKTEETELKVSIIEPKPFSIPLKVKSNEDVFELTHALTEVYEYARKSDDVDLKKHTLKVKELINQLIPQLSLSEMLELKALLSVDE